MFLARRFLVDWFTLVVCFFWGDLKRPTLLVFGNLLNVSFYEDTTFYFGIPALFRRGG